MKKKRVTALLLVAAVGIGSISVNMHVGVADKAPVPDTAITAQAAAKPSASALASAVKKAYGDQYAPNMKLGKDEIKDRYGVDDSLYSSAYAEVPMISARVDELVIFKAKNADAKKKILRAVKKYQKDLKASTMQYPQNLLMIQGSRVYKNGKYVCFIMLGQISRNIEENGSDADIIKAYKAQNKKAVNAIKKQLD